ncbi:hypothetical protein MHYP_G00272680 [Metynnis hypsauchen]
MSTTKVSSTAEVTTAVTVSITEESTQKHHSETSQLPQSTPTQNRPTRNANIILRIVKDYNADFENLNSQASKNLIAILTRELSVIFKRVDPQNFKDVVIVSLKQGSIIVNSTARYNYPNNQSQIDFLNNNLESSLKITFNNSDLLKYLSEAFGGNVSLTEITMQAVGIANVSELRPFLNCSLDFANFTMILGEGFWTCDGPCKSNPSYCNGHFGTYNVGENDNVAGKTSVGTFKPHLENVDTTVDLTTNRPEAKP